LKAQLETPLSYTILSAYMKTIITL